MAYQAGSVFVQVLPSLRGFQTKVAAELRGMRVNKDVEVGVKVDTDRATSGLSRLNSAASNANGGLSRLVGASNSASNGLGRTGRSANSTGSSLAALGAILGATGVGLFGVAAAAGVAAAGLAVIPGVALAAAGAVGVFAGAFSGVGDALKGYQADQDAAATATRKGSAVAASNARAVRDAQQQIGDARKNQARVAEDGARRIADAERNQADVATRGAEQIQAAHERVNDALGDEVVAQQRLSDARQDAIRTLDDLRERTSDYALSEEDAVIGVERSRERLNKVLRDSSSSDLDRREAALNLRQAEERLSDVQRERTQTAQELAVAERKGVNGADAVVAAQRDVADAHANVQKAQQDLSRTTAQVDRDNQDAARATADARREAGEAQEDAAIAVSRALQGLKDVQDQQAESAAAAAATSSKYADAMAKLTPAQREFVKQLIRMRDPLKKLGDAGANEFLPGLTQMLRDSEGLFPIFHGYLKNTGKIMGDTARDMGRLFSSDEFKKNLETALRASEPITRAIGGSLVRMTDKIIEFAAKMAPASEGFATFIGDLTTGMEGFFTSLEPHADDFKSIWESLGRIAKVILPAAGEAIGKIADVLAPILEEVADFLEKHSDKIDEILLGLGALFIALKAAKLVAKVTSWTGRVTELVDGLGSSFWRNRDKADDMWDSIDGEGKRRKTRLGKGAGKGVGKGGGAGAALGALGAVGVAAGAVGGYTPEQLDQFKQGDLGSDLGVFGNDFAGDPFGAFGREIVASLTPPDETKKLWNDFSSWWKESWAGLGKTVLQWGVDIGIDIPAIVRGIPGFFSEMPSKVNGWFDETGRTVDTTMTGWIGSAAINAALVVTSIGEWFSKLPENVRRWFEETKQKVIEKLGQLREDADKKVEGVTSSITGLFEGLPGRVREAFENLKRWALEKLEELKLKAQEPIRVFIETVWDNGRGGGIKPIWNNIATVFGMPKLATGGILPGYTPGRDVHVAALSGGEAVMRPEWTRAVGAGYVNAANSAARIGGVAGAQQFVAAQGLPGFADGGIIGDIWDRASGFISSLFSGGGGAAVDQVKGLFSGVLGDAQRTPGQGMWRDAIVKIPSMVVDAVVKKASDFASGVGSSATAGAFTGKAAGGVQRWSGIVLQALAMLGQPASLLQTTLRRMNQESGGNPRAINLWDINAQRGIPSKGLMQVIDPTFRANRDPRAPNDVWDPLANVLASMRYAMRRYGSLPAAYNKPGGYDSGGWLPPGLSTVYNGTGKPEPVLTRDQLDALMGSATGGGGDTYIVNPSARLDEVQIARETSRIQQFNRRLAV